MVSNFERFIFNLTLKVLKIENVSTVKNLVNVKTVNFLNGNVFKSVGI